MSGWASIFDHSFAVLQGIGIVAGLGFTAAAFRRDERSRRITNLLALTAEHRDIWSEVYQRDELARVLEPQADLSRAPVTNQEALFVTFLLLHLSATYRAMQMGMFTTRQALAKDIQWFLGLPVPGVVWRQSRSFLEADFVAFVDRCQKSGGRSFPAAS